jgi:hypothetical protein
MPKFGNSEPWDLAAWVGSADPPHNPGGVSVEVTSQVRPGRPTLKRSLNSVTVARLPYFVLT